MGEEVTSADLSVKKHWPQGREVEISEAKKHWPQEKYKNQVWVREIVRDWKPWSWKYKWPDRLAVKKGLTEKQKAFVDEYLQSHNATAAYRAAKGTLNVKDERVPWDRANWMKMKNLDKVKDYLIQKLADDAELCLELQMEMIQNEDIPAAVRMDWIKDRLNRLGVGKQKEENTEISGVGEVTITIKHKQPTVIEWEVVESEDLSSVDLTNKPENDG